MTLLAPECGCPINVSVCRLQCIPVQNQGFSRGSYICNCSRGFYFPLPTTPKHFNGTEIEEEYDKKMRVSELKKKRTKQCCTRVYPKKLPSSGSRPATVLNCYFCSIHFDQRYSYVARTLGFKTPCTCCRGLYILDRDLLLRSHFQPVRVEFCSTSLI